MAARTIDRVWEVARLPTEVIVIDNGSPCRARRFPARCTASRTNRGVATAWNTGIDLARRARDRRAQQRLHRRARVGRGPATRRPPTGRRIAFPYTDHCDGEGFRQPDQAGTAGWCFMLTRGRLRRRSAPFDELVQPRVRRGHRLLAPGLGAGHRAVARARPPGHPLPAQLGHRGRPRRLAAARRTATCTAGSTGSSRWRRRPTTTARSSSTTDCTHRSSRREQLVSASGIPSSSPC